MAQGKVKWFNDSRGFGFIERNGGGELFVHFSSIAGDGHRTLTPGQSVQFDIYEGKKGLEAHNVGQED